VIIPGFPVSIVAGLLKIPLVGEPLQIFKDEEEE
jgi:hypothetical protein